MTPVELVIAKFTPPPIEDAGRCRSGTTVLAQLLGIHKTSVNNWKRTGRIPSKYLGAILAESKRRRLGLAAEDLM